MTSVNPEKLERLQECEELVDALVEHMLDAVIIMDWDGTIQFANNTAAKMLGLKNREAAVGRSPWEFLHPDCVERAQREMAMVKEGIGDFLASYQLLIDGRIIDVESHGAEVQYKGRSADMVVFRDVTDRERQKAELQRLNATLEARIEQRTDALEKSERMFRAMTESMHAMVMIANGNEGRTVYANPMATKITGYSEAELLASPPVNFFTEESLKKITAYQQAWWAGEDVSAITMLEIVTKSGARRWLETAWTVIDLGDDGLHKVTVSFDVTERNMAEQRLAESETKFRALAETTSAMIVIISSTETGFETLYANDETLRTMGYTWEEFRQIDPMQLFDPEHEPTQKKLIEFQGSFPKDSGHRSDVLEMRAMTKTGDRLWLEHTSTQVALGGRICDVSTSFNITERKRAEQQLAESENKFKALAESASAMIVIGAATEDGPEIVYANESALKTFGYSWEEFRQMNPVAFFSNGDDAQLQLLMSIGENYQSGAPYPSTVELKITTKNGEERWLASTGQYVELGGRMCDLSTSFDITERKRAEALLLENEKKFKALAESTTARILISYRDGEDIKFLYANKAMLESMDKTWEELAQESFKFCGVEDDGDEETDTAGQREWRDAARKAREAGSSNYSYEFIDEDGSWVQMHVVETILDGKECTIWTGFDITEQKRIQQALVESEDKYRAIFETTGTGTIIFGDDSIIALANDEWAKMVGFRREEMEGKLSWREFFTEESLKKMRQYHEKRSKDPDSVPRVYEADMQNRNGDVLHGIVTISLVPGTTQRVGSFQDLTEIKKAQKEIVESESRYRTIFETTGTGTIIFDDDAVIRLANEEWSRLVGYTLDEMLNRMTVMDFIAQKALAQIEENHRKRSADPDSVPRTYETTVEDRSGREHVGIATISMIPGTKMRVASFQDLTELKRAQNQMYQADKMAALGQIIAGVAHEINNPNNFIYFNLPILRKYLDSIKSILDRETESAEELKILGMAYDAFWDDTYALLENMEHGSSRITSIVADLKNYVRSDEESQMKMENPKTVINQVMTLVGKQVRKMVKHFEVETAEPLPEILMNAGKIEQVLINLIINASQAANKDDSYVKMTTTLCDREVKIAVSDNGAGIPQANLEQIFEPFFTSKGRETGTGLGLSISQKIIEDHGGTITVETDEGKGSCFTVHLPVPASA